MASKATAPPITPPLPAGTELAPPDSQQTAMATAATSPLRAAPAFGMAPRSFEEAWRFANMIAMSELAPSAYRGKPANCMVAMQMGAEVGLSPMAAMQNIAVINGRPSLWGDAALAVVQVHPDYEWHKEYLEGEGDICKGIFVIKRKGHEPHTSTFSVADAKKANLWSKEGPWQTYSKRMLKLRARGFGLRDKFADALRGLITAEEAMDLPPVIEGIAVGPEQARLESESIGKKTLNATEQLRADLAAKNGAVIEAAPEKVSVEEAQRQLEERRKALNVEPAPVEAESVTVPTPPALQESAPVEGVPWLFDKKK